MEASIIVHKTIQALLYLVGVLVHLKIISVCWKEKDGKVWMIHMTNSIFTIIYFAFYLPFFTVTSEIPNLSDQYTGEWFCYLATFVIFYGFTIITFNSLLIAVMKYVFIVRNEDVRVYGDEKALKFFFIVDLTVPLFVATFACITRDFEGFAALNSCFGTTQQVLKQYNTWDKNLQKFFLCDLNKEKDQAYSYTLYAVKQVACVIKSCAVLVTNTNLPEAFFYYKIFQTMKW